MDQPLTKDIPVDGEMLDLAAYEKVGGYEALRKGLRLAPKEITETVKQSNLRGRGGAGFPTGMKWSFVPMGPSAPRPKYLVANADEMEPGTFKDRLLLEGNPHQLIEGMALAAFALEAEVAYIFIRGEYVLAAARLERAIAEAAAKKFLGMNILGSDRNLQIYIHRSAGRYMCGE